MLSQELSYIQLKKFDDLVRLVSLSLTPVLQHVKLNDGRHVYFIQASLMVGKPLIYFYEGNEEFKGKYVIYNRFKDEITFSEKPSSDAQSLPILILEVEKTNILAGVYKQKDLRFI
ncbi:MAG: hypothetical protein N3E48_00955 [Candidatus Bathyarchaeota archaeon]|nr:hypothetical protein [Candidatus Bathyarchaeota archaeon]